MTTTSLIDRRMFLGAHPLFNELNPEDVNALLAITAQESAAAGDTVLRQGDTGQYMYIITHGRVAVCIGLADGQKLTVGELAAGEAFGEIALFDDQPRTATIVAIDPCRFLTIDGPRFKTYLLAHPGIALHLLRVMSQRLRATDDLLKESLYAEVSARLAQTLCNIASAYGTHTREGLRIDVPFDNHELGRIAGVPADVVTAQLRHWTDAGLIRMHGGLLTLTRPEQLSRPHWH